ncbi:MAG: hypothetical protein AAB525_00650 [Patescibacteria group bacterium]
MHKKIVIVAGILVVFIVAGIIIIHRLFLENNKLLIDYLPAETDFWFWRRNDGFSDKSKDVLKQLGADANIVAALQNQPGEIVVYYLKGSWFKLENLGKKIDFMEEEGADIVGFLSQNYVGERLAGFEFIFKPLPYYFALKQTENALHFSFIHQDKFNLKQLTVFQPKKYPPEFLNNDAVILAAKLQDQTLSNSIVDTLKNNIVNFTAFDFPVVISKTLPDQTIITEKKVKPELFSWQEFSPYAYQLRLNQQEVDMLKLRDQLETFSSNYNYYQDDKIAIFALNNDWSKTAILNNINSANFFYLNLLADADLAEIMGKSEALKWLQNLEAKSIMIYDDGVVMQGELKFNNL